MIQHGRRRILIDVDGVLADFTSSALALIKDKLDIDASAEDLTHWDVFKTLDLKDKEHILFDAVENDEFCMNIKPFPGAKEAVDRLEKEFGNVYVVTSPMDTPNWISERVEWLKDYMKVPLNRQCHIKSKHLVAGCVLIDDTPEKLEAWKAHWPSGLPLLMDAPYNRTEERFVRVKNWDEVFDRIKEHFQRVGKSHL